MHVRPAWCTRSAGGGRRRGRRWHPGARRSRARARGVARPARGPPAGPIARPETCTPRSPLRDYPTASCGACPPTSRRSETTEEGSAPTRARLFTARQNFLSALLGAECGALSTWGRIALQDRTRRRGVSPPFPRSTMDLSLPVIRSIFDRLLEQL